MSSTKKKSKNKDDDSTATKTKARAVKQVSDSEDSESDDGSGSDNDLNEDDAKKVYNLIGDLLTTLEKVNTLYKDSANFSGVSLGNPEEKCLAKYKKFHTRNPSGNLHADDFKLLLSRFKQQFLKGDDQFISDGTIMIRSQEQIKDANPKVKIMLSSIYKRAIGISDQAIKHKNSGLKSVFTTVADKIVLPDRILQILYKIFIIIDDDNRGKYNKILDKLNKQIEKNTPPVNDGKDSKDSKDVKDVKSTEGSKDASTTGLSGMIASLRPALEGSGIQIPADAKLPSEQEMGAMFSAVLQSDMVKGLIGSLTGLAASVQKTNEVPDLSKMNGDEIKNAISKIAQPLIEGANKQNQSIPMPTGATPSGAGVATQNPTPTGSSNDKKDT